MKIISKIVFLLAFVPLFLQAESVYDFIPRHSQLVLQVNLNNIAGMKSIQNDLIRNVSRQTGITKDKDKSMEFSDLVESITVVMPVLTEDEFFIFVKTKGCNSAFLKRLEEMTGVRHISVKNQGLEEYRITVPDTSPFPGLPSKNRTFAWTFIGKNTAVFAKDDLTGYLRFKERGLTAERRKELLGEKLLAAGYLETTPEFLAGNPYLPRIRRAVYSLSGDASGALRINALADCGDEQTANQTVIQLQQYIMVGGMILNQLDPELMQEWINAVKVARNLSAVSLNADFSAAFISRLASASEKAVEKINQKPSAQQPASAPAPAGGSMKK